MPRDWVFSTAGSNITGVGTIASPYATIEKCAAMMSSGDTIVGRGGTYKRGAGDLAVPSGGGSWAAATTIKAYDDEEVILTPYDETTYVGTRTLNFASNRSWIIVDGLIIDGLNQSGGKGGAGGMVLSYNGHHFRIINTEIRYTGASGLGTSNATHNEFINLNLHHNNHQLPPEDPNYSKRGYGIYLESGNNLIQGCDMHHNRGYGMQMYSGQPWKPDDNIITGNTFRDNELNGLLVWSGINAIVTNNVIYSNGTLASGQTANASERYGLYVSSGAHSAHIFHNTVYDHPLSAFLLGGSANNVLVKNNIFYGNGSTHTVVTTAGATGAELYNNIIYHANASLRLSNGANATLSNNLNDDPLFVDAGNNDFHVQSGSPAINAGVAVGIAIDKDGIIRPQGPDVDIGAYETLADGQARWTAPSQNPTGSWVDSGLTAQSIRTMLQGTYITAGATSVRLALRGRSSGSYTMEHVTISDRDTGWDIDDGSSTQVTFGDTWANGVTVAAGETIYSDPITFTVANGQDVFVTWYSPDSAGIYFNGGAITNTFRITGDESETLDWGGLTPDATNNHIYNVAWLEEVVSPVTDSAPGLSVALVQTVTPGVLHPLGADVEDENDNIVSGYVYDATGKIGFDFDPSGCTITHKTS